MSLLLDLAVGTVVAASPLILAAMGGLTSERGGVMNIALEGNMLMGAIGAAVCASATHSPLCGLAGGIGFAIALSWLHWLLTQTYRMDHIVSGMALNAVALGASGFLNKLFIDPGAGPVPALNLNFYIFSALLIPLAAFGYMKLTRGGLRLTAVGNDPAKSRQMGLMPTRVRFAALSATGVFCGLAGAMIVSNARYFTDNMTAGRGYIALAALIVGSWRALPAFAACLIFGLFQELQFEFQGNPVLGISLPREFWFCLPYAITIIALAGFIGKSRVPAGLGKF